MVEADSRQNIKEQGEGSAVRDELPTLTRSWEGSITLQRRCCQISSLILASRFESSKRLAVAFEIVNPFHKIQSR
jgi:hypothetical protein